MAYRINTKCIQGGYSPENGEPRVLPLYQSTTFKYSSTEHVGKLFDLAEPGHMYTRISNPTTEAFENKINSLEGGVGCLATSSGQAAIMITALSLCRNGDNLLASSTIYGGTITLLQAELSRLGISVTFFDSSLPAEEIEKLIKPNTKFIYGETLANPALSVFDIESFAGLAHKHNIPLVIDNTFPTPYLCRPIEFGADIVIHSTTKYMDGHASCVGGAIVDSGNFDWTKADFPELTSPNEAYHGLVFTEAFGKAAFIARARTVFMRDMGATPAPFNSYLTNLGLETLHVRMQRHCENAMKVASFLENEMKTSGKISFVNYPGLDSDKWNNLARKYLRTDKGEFVGASGVISFGVKGGREVAAKFMDSLELAKIVVHVADTRTSVLHPATATHRQLTDEELVACGISPDLVRMSVGIEDIDDIIDDIKQALAQI